MNQHENEVREVLNMDDRLPPDLLRIRAAAERVGLTVLTVRNYIYEGRHGRKLRTYRFPDDPNTVLVSLAELVRMASEVRRQARKANYEGVPDQVKWNPSSDVGQALKFVREATIARLGVSVTYPALLSMLILEHARHLGWKGLVSEAKPVEQPNISPLGSEP
mgnify:CR=1 FL=1